jgi:hypothetical protein
MPRESEVALRVARVRRMALQARRSKGLPGYLLTVKLTVADSPVGT